MSSHSNDMWYVLVDGQSYGPFTADVMVGFVAETRVVASSLISQHPQQGYALAADHHVFREWLHAASIRPIHQVEAVEQIQRSEAQDIRRKEQAKTVYIVMAEIDPKTGMSFLRKLQGFGHAQRIGDTVWLLQTAHNLDEVKSTLAATLSKRDRLFIHDCFANQQSWENIGADLDDRIRQMWQTVER
ncbi:MAG: hypothetical protein ABJ275_01535 [Maricaulaceae bacterium]